MLGIIGNFLIIYQVKLDKNKRNNKQDEFGDCSSHRLAHFQTRNPTCSPSPLPIIHFCLPHPPAGTVDLISWWQVRHRGRLNFFGWWNGGRRRFLTEGGVVTGWAATLTRAPWVPSAGAKVWRCSGVRKEEAGGGAVGIRSSKDKHQWEYERLDPNRPGSHAIPWQKKPQERAWPCAHVFCCLLLSPSSEQNCHWNY